MLLKKCCCCVDLRAGALILSGLGIVFNIAAIFLYDNKGGLYITYCILKSLICLLGFIGVLKDNVKFVKIYAVFYWIVVALGFLETIIITVGLFIIKESDLRDVCKGMIERHETEMDLKECVAYLHKLSILGVIFLALKSLVELHFGLAVWSYYQKLKAELYGERVINEEPTSNTTYGTIPSAS